MAGSMSNYLEDIILDHILGDTSFATAATVYIGLWTATLSDTSTGATAGEVSGGSYARVAVTNNTTNWPDASGGTKSSGAAFDFGTASGSWGDVTDWAIVDSSSGAGNIYYYGTLTTPKTIASGDSAQFASGDIDITQA
jgi:hypothetical protein